MTALKSSSAPSPSAKASGIESGCAATGMRMTEQRRVIARVLAEAEDHPDVEELYRRWVAVDDKISISTVYRTVKLFEDAGIIERHDFREGRARYEQMRDSHHDHLINLRDGTVDVMENRVGFAGHKCPGVLVLTWGAAGSRAVRRGRGPVWF
jgi:Fur family ferric uptake transcriptional regulator